MNPSPPPPPPFPRPKSLGAVSHALAGTYNPGSNERQQAVNCNYLRQLSHRGRPLIEGQVFHLEIE